AFSDYYLKHSGFSEPRSSRIIFCGANERSHNQIQQLIGGSCCLTIMLNAFVKRRPVVLAHDEQSSWSQSHEVAIEGWVSCSSPPSDLSNPRALNTFSCELVNGGGDDAMAEIGDRLALNPF